MKKTILYILISLFLSNSPLNSFNVAPSCFQGFNAAANSCYNTKNDQLLGLFSFGIYGSMPSGGNINDMISSINSQYNSCLNSADAGFCACSGVCA